MELVRACPVRGGIAVLFVLSLAAGPALASGARDGIKAQPGEIVLVRNVPTRIAYRQAPPATALIVDPKPNREIASALGTGELSDAEYSSLDAGAAGGMRGNTTVERTLGSALNSALGVPANHHNPTVAGGGIADNLGGPLGAIGKTTGNIGDQVRGALAQFPMLGAPAGGGR